MALPHVDESGNIHRPSGPGGGQFAAKPSSAPRPLTSAPKGERLQSNVAVMWGLLDRDRGAASSRRTASAVSTMKRGVFRVSVPRISSGQAPIVAEVVGTAEGGEPLRYREVDGRLFSQVFGVRDRESGVVVPLPAVTRASDGAASPAPLPRAASVSEVQAAAAAGALVPVPADEDWLRATATHEAADVAAEDEVSAGAALQERMDDYAAIDGDVWRHSRQPVYRAPVEAEAPFEAPIVVSVEPAPDTSFAAVDGYYPSDEYQQAVARVRETARATGAEVGAVAEEPPIRWLAELGLIEGEEWRRGARLDFSPSSSLTEENFRERLAQFRAQIVEQLPGAVGGDVGSFLTVGEHRVEYAALTKTQQDEYRRYIMFGLEHGLV